MQTNRALIINIAARAISDKAGLAYEVILDVKSNKTHLHGQLLVV